MTTALIETIVREVRKAVRQEVRIELLLAGLTECPTHWETMDRVELATHLRDLADRLDPRPGNGSNA